MSARAEEPNAGFTLESPGEMQKIPAPEPHLKPIKSESPQVGPEHSPTHTQIGGLESCVVCFTFFKATHISSIEFDRFDGGRQMQNITTVKLQ